MKSHTRYRTTVWSRCLCAVEIYKKRIPNISVTCSIFIFAEPLSGWRYAGVQERRTAEDRALEIKRLLTECYPRYEKIILVMDNLNTHALTSLYKCFPAPEARSYAKRPEIHYTPKHGSWLNIAEIG